MPIDLENYHIIEFMKNVLYYFYYQFHSDDFNNPLCAYLNHYLCKNKIRFWEMHMMSHQNVFTIFRDRYIKTYDRPISSNQKYQILRFLSDHVHTQIYSETIPGIYFDNVLLGYRSENLQNFSKISYEEILNVLHSKTNARLGVNPSSLNRSISYIYDRSGGNCTLETETYLNTFENPLRNIGVPETITPIANKRVGVNLVNKKDPTGEPISKLVKLSDEICLDNYQRHTQLDDNNISGYGYKQGKSDDMPGYGQTSIQNYGNHSGVGNSKLIPATQVLDLQQHTTNFYDKEQFEMGWLTEGSNIIDPTDGNIVAIQSKKDTQTAVLNTSLLNSDARNKDETEEPLSVQLEKVLVDWFKNKKMLNNN